MSETIEFKAAIISEMEEAGQAILDQLQRRLHDLATQRATAIFHKNPPEGLDQEAVAEALTVAQEAAKKSVTFEAKKSGTVVPDAAVRMAVSNPNCRKGLKLFKSRYKRLERDAAAASAKKKHDTTQKRKAAAATKKPDDKKPDDKKPDDKADSDS